MKLIARRSLLAAFALAALGLLVLPAVDAAAQAGRKKTEGCLIELAEPKMVIKDRNSKKEIEFRVKQATSVLDKAGTVATKDGRKAQLVDLETNRPVIAYWLADPENPGGKFANKVDQPDFIDDETGQPDPDLLENAGCKLE
ncbi:MAG TPA: hypothetical protein VIN04_09295 [Myxococcota bacterium]